MEDNSELEEGEACYNEDDDDNLDPDIALSYIDERIKHVLGHFQKDFEGGMTADNLGAKFGGYGSFLPPNKHSSPIWWHDSTQQKNCNKPNGPGSLPLEGCPQNLKAPSNLPQSVRLQTNSCSSDVHNIREPLVDISKKHESCSPLTQAVDRYPKDGTSIRSGSLTDLRSLKVRIKVRSDDVAQRNAAIYNGLGLDDSPSSSSGDSLDGCVGKSHVGDSLDNIIQVMTSFSVPGGLLLSPLPESLFWLSKKEKHFRGSESMPSINCHQEHSSKLVDKTASLLCDPQLLKDKKSVDVNENQEELEHGNKRRLHNGRKKFMKKKSEEVASKAENFLANGLKRPPLYNSVGNNSESTKAVDGVPEISCEVNLVGLKDGSFSSKLVEEEMLELVYEQDYGKNDKQSSSSSLVEKASGNKAVNSYNDDLVDIRCDDSNEGSKTTAPLKDYRDASKCVEDMDLHRKVSLNSTFHSQNASYLPPEKGKPAPTGKNKLKGLLSNGKIVVSKKDNSRAEIGAVRKDKKNVRHVIYSCKSKTDNLESDMDSQVKDNQRDFLGNKKVESLGHCQDTMAKAFGNLQNESNLDSQRAQPTLAKRSNERFSSAKIDTHSIGGTSSKDVPSLTTPIPENGLTSDIVPAAVAPLLIEENWVCCDRCQKWRLLPFGLKPEQLPEKWLCSMLNWLPGMNRCEISEEDTTAALNALYQLPVSQNQTNGTASGITTSNVYHLDQNYRNSFQVMSDQGKKKRNLKGMKHAGGSVGLSHVSNSLENHVQEPGKSRSTNDKNYPYPPEPSLIRKSKVQHLSKLRNVVGVKSEHSLNAKPKNGVDAKQLKMKSKRKDDGGHRPSERSKTEDTNVRRVVLNSKVGFQTMNRTDMKNNETSFSEDRKCGGKDGILSFKKLGEQTQTSSDVGSLDMQRIKRDSFTKKRKLKEDTAHYQNSALNDGVYVKEEGSESGLRKEGKAQVIKTERKFSSSSDGDSNARKKVRMSPFYPSGSRDFQADVVEEDGDFDKDLELGKHKKYGMSEQSLDAREQIQKNFGSKQVSIAAAVSNSKTSGDHKTKVNCKVVNESIVQSVSPPLRMSNNGAISGCVIVRKEKFCSDFESKSLKISTQHEDRDAMQKFSSEALGSQLYNGDFDIKEQIGCCTNDSSYGYEQCYESRIKKTRGDNALLSQKEVLSSKEDMASTSEHKLKGTDPISHCLKKSPKIEQDVKPGSGKMSRNERNHTGTNNFTGNRSIDNGTDPELKDTRLKDHDHSDLRMGPLNNPNGKYGLQQNLSLDPEFGNKVDTIEKESGSGKSKCLLNSDGKSKQIHKKAHDSHGQLLYYPDSEDMLKASKISVDYGMENGGNHNLSDPIPERQGLRNLSASSPDRMESSNEANDILKEAKDLRKYADRLKSSGFHFESNEAYFQAALKFLHGALLLETCNAKNGKHGEVSQMQFYYCTIELLRACADGFEKRQEMAAAALAYKCMEVAYMRIVYCKHFCLNRDWQELKVTLHAVPQGPQGASQTSASDDVNLNNQTTVSKAIVSMGNSCSAAGNQVLVAPNLPNFVRLLDFTQIVNLAMEASRKSHNAFAAANVSVEDAQNRDFVASVKRVIDFSFQDVEELIRLVHLALKVSSYSGFGGTRE